MSTDIDYSDVVWIVVASNHRWGASNSLYEAMKNARLPEPPSPAEFFAGELEYRFNLDDALENYKDEFSTRPDDDGEVLDVVIHRFDPALWSGYEVNPLNGGVRFTRKEGVEADWDAEMEKAVLVAKYSNGVLAHK